eukprot:c11860_g1_i1.p1 GENE.c11860_g1_i1~~c11860_g1_i1.p1  ORF type:complete len:379 (+),score=57.93 c11860_g1_i1:540-1676(+)
MEPVVTIKRGVLWVPPKVAEGDNLVSGSTEHWRSKEQEVQLVHGRNSPHPQSGCWELYLVRLYSLTCSHRNDGNLLRISPPFRLRSNIKTNSKRKRTGIEESKERAREEDSDSGTEEDDPKIFCPLPASMCDGCLTKNRLKAFWVKISGPDTFTETDAVRTVVTEDTHSTEFKFRMFEKRSESQAVLVARWIDDGTLASFEKAIRAGNLEETKRLAYLLGPRANLVYRNRGPLACCMHSKLTVNCSTSVIPENGKYHAIASWLISDEWRADINFRAPNNSTPLHVASESGALDMVIFLISNGANILATTAQGWTPLHNALKSQLKGPISYFLAERMQGFPREVLEEVLARSNCGNMEKLSPMVYAEAMAMTFPIQSNN